MVSLFSKFILQEYHINAGYRAIEKIKIYTWNETARKTLDVYRRVLKRE